MRTTGITERMRRFRLPTLMGFIASLAIAFAVCMPMTSGEAIRMATSHLQDQCPGIDLGQYVATPCRQRWHYKRKENVSWIVDFRRRNGSDGFLVIIDYPEQRFPGPDVYFDEYDSSTARGVIPALLRR